MPKFKITTPDGTFIVTAPDEQTAMNALREQGGNATQNSGAIGVPLSEPAADAPPQKSGSVGADIAKSGATGLRQGVESGLGQFGDAAEMQGDIVSWGAKKLGLGEGGQRIAGVAARWLHPGSVMASTKMIRHLTDPLVKTTGTEDVLAHQPETVGGEYARTIGQFAPAAAIGPGGIPTKIASAVVPAVVSETAGQITKGSKAEPYARAGGALLGGLGVAVGSSMLSKSAKPPTAQELKDAAGYETLKPQLKGAQVNGDTYKKVVADLRAVADDFGIVPEEHAGIMSILARHEKAAASGEGASLYDLELLRRSLQNAGKSITNRSAGALSGQLVDTLRKSVDEMGTANLATPPGANPATTVDLATVDALTKARETWRTGLKTELVETAMEKAKNAASGYENGLRTEFRKILNNKTLSRQFTSEELDAMRLVVKGTFASNAARFAGTMGLPTDQGRNWLGAMLGGGAGGGIGTAIAGPIGGAIGTAAVLGAGTAARGVSNALTRSYADLANAVVAGGPNAKKIYADAMQAMSAARNAGLIRAAVQAETAARQPVTSRR